MMITLWCHDTWLEEICNLDRWFSQLGTSIYREFSIAMFDYRRMMGYAKTYNLFGGAVAVIFVANHGYKLQDLRYNP